MERRQGRGAKIEAQQIRVDGHPDDEPEARSEFSRFACLSYDSRFAYLFCVCNALTIWPRFDQVI